MNALFQRRWPQAVRDAFRRPMLMALLSLVVCHVHVSSDDGVHASRIRASLSLAETKVREAGDSARAIDHVQLGDAQLRFGRVEESIHSFERAIEMRPEWKPELWQYGIALAFAQRYREGRELFEMHRRVNPHDVENAAWHFLCVAKDADLATARQLLLPAPSDPRPPMKQVLRRLAGGDDAIVVDAVRDTRSMRQRDSAQFFADLYLGLIADAEGNSAKAEQYMQAAAKTGLGHYMADVARVYAKRLTLGRAKK
ncbi:tetratricopeptide repeat protein [Crateriforma spongiae]|uniref:tetratricopeptide repeat protein n=1 Tax=Crateriforma spongiae TaxID=2724528 RepID=UPI00144794CB|nr:tetratricopeptide repeat protein [Crateriforma spongiae]